MEGNSVYSSLQGDLCLNISMGHFLMKNKTARPVYVRKG